MKTLFLIAVLMGGVANAAPPLNTDCDNVASFAKAIAKVKSAGISQDQVESYISKPTAQTFPITLIRRQVYASSWSPSEAYASYYSQCLVVGYNYLLQSMSDADELLQLRDENRKLKSENALIHDELTQLDHALQRTQTQRPIVQKTEVKAYGSPIETNR
jgi:hypothetical protein